MNMLLMHKNDALCKFTLYDDKPSEILEIYNEKLLPIGLRGDKDFATSNLMSWHNSKAISRGRMNLPKIEEELDAFGGLNKVALNSLGLSLNDCYWYKPDNTAFTWEEVNFRDNTFSANLFSIEAEAFQKPGMSPDYRTNGALKKFWLCSDGVSYFIKSGEFAGVTNGSGILAANEVAVGEIAKILNMDAVRYVKFDIGTDEKFCLSECFVNRDEDFVSARDLMNQYNFYEEEELLPLLDNILPEEEQHKLYDMMLLDVLVHNTDRHADNFGIILDANTGQVKRFAPIFDTGNCLGWNTSEVIDNNMRFPKANRNEILNLINIKENFAPDKLGACINIIKEVYADFDISEERTANALEELVAGFALVKDKTV